MKVVGSTRFPVQPFHTQKFLFGLPSFHGAKERIMEKIYSFLEREELLVLANVAEALKEIRKKMSRRGVYISAQTFTVT